MVGGGSGSSALGGDITMVSEDSVVGAGGRVDLRGGYSQGSAGGT